MGNHTIKKIMTLALAAVTIGLTCAPDGWSASTARVAWVYNQVQVTRGGRWVGAGNGTVVGSGAYVRTGNNSRAQVHYADGSVMRLGARSVARVREVRAKQVQVHRGKAYFQVKPQRQQMKVRTRNAVATVLGTEFVVEVKDMGTKQGLLGAPLILGQADSSEQFAQNTDNTITQITTLEGSVGVSGPNGGPMIQVTEGMTTFIGNNFQPQTPQQIDLKNFESSQSDLMLDEEDIATGELSPDNPANRTTVQQNTPGAQGTQDTSPTTGNLELIIK